MKITRNLILVAVAASLQFASTSGDIMLQPGYGQQESADEIKPQVNPVTKPSNPQEQVTLADEFKRFQNLHRIVEGQIVQMLNQGQLQELQPYSRMPIGIVGDPWYRHYNTPKPYYYSTNIQSSAPIGIREYNVKKFGFNHPRTAAYGNEYADKLLYARSVSDGAGTDGGHGAALQTVPTTQAVGESNLSEVDELPVSDIEEIDDLTASKHVGPRQIGRYDAFAVGNPEHHPIDSTGIGSRIINTAQDVGRIIDRIAPGLRNKDSKNQGPIVGAPNFISQGNTEEHRNYDQYHPMNSAGGGSQIVNTAQGIGRVIDSIAGVAGAPAFMNPESYENKNSKHTEQIIIAPRLDNQGQQQHPGWNSMSPAQNSPGPQAGDARYYTLVPTMKNANQSAINAATQLIQRAQHYTQLNSQPGLKPELQSGHQPTPPLDHGYDNKSTHDSLEPSQAAYQPSRQQSGHQPSHQQSGYQPFQQQFRYHPSYEQSLYQPFYQQFRYQPSHQQSRYQPSLQQSGYQPPNQQSGSQPSNQPGYQSPHQPPNQRTGYPNQQPSHQSGYQPLNQQAGYQPSNQPGYQPPHQSPNQRTGYPNQQPSQQSGYQPPNQQSGYQPSNQPGYQSPHQSPNQRTGYPNQQPSHQSGYQPLNQQAGYQPSNQPGYQPPHQSPNQRTGYPNQQPSQQSGYQPPYQFLYRTDYQNGHSPYGPTPSIQPGSTTPGRTSSLSGGVSQASASPPSSSNDPTSNPSYQPSYQRNPYSAYNPYGVSRMIDQYGRAILSVVPSTLNTVANPNTYLKNSWVQPWMPRYWHSV